MPVATSALTTCWLAMLHKIATLAMAILDMAIKAMATPAMAILAMAILDMAIQVIEMTPTTSKAMDSTHMDLVALLEDQNPTLLSAAEEAPMDLLTLTLIAPLEKALVNHHLTASHLTPTNPLSQRVLLTPTLMTLTDQLIPTERLTPMNHQTLTDHLTLTATMAMAADMINQATEAMGKPTHTDMVIMATAAMTHSHLPTGAMAIAIASLNPNTVTMAMAATTATVVIPMGMEETLMATAAMVDSKHMAATPIPTRSHTIVRPTGLTMAMAMRVNKHQNSKKTVLQNQTITHKIATVNRLWKQSTLMVTPTPMTQIHIQMHTLMNMLMTVMLTSIQTTMPTLKARP